jgi:hypothetical protein
VSSVPGLLTERELFASSPTTLFRLDVDAEISWTGDALELTSAGTTHTAPRIRSSSAS